MMIVQPPVDLTVVRTLTMVALVAHVIAGSAGLASGIVAACASKGGRIHRAAGNVFFYSMSTMALFAAYLAVAVPDQLVNLFISGFTFYMVGTAWLTVRRRDGTTGVWEKVALGVAVIIAAPFLILSFQLATGMAPLFKSAVPFRGPVLIAIYAFTSVLTIAMLGDARVVFAGGISGVPRIARHLWRMCFGLTLAAGSAFTNGFARLLPGPYHVPPIFFLPQFLPILLLIFWMVRVRMPGWYKKERAPGHSAKSRGNV